MSELDLLKNTFDILHMPYRILRMNQDICKILRPDSCDTGLMIGEGNGLYKARAIFYFKDGNRVNYGLYNPAIMAEHGFAVSSKSGELFHNKRLVPRVLTKPQVGDKYYPRPESEYKLPMPESELIITEVRQLHEDGKAYEIIASDGMAYDCVWSEILQVWVYNLD